MIKLAVELNVIQCQMLRQTDNTILQPFAVKTMILKCTKQLRSIELKLRHLHGNSNVEKTMKTDETQVSDETNVFDEPSSIETAAGNVLDAAREFVDAEDGISGEDTWEAREWLLRSARKLVEAEKNLPKDSLKLLLDKRLKH